MIGDKTIQLDYQQQSIVNTLNTNQTNYSQHLQTEIDDYIDFKTKMITLLSNNTDLDSLSIADHSYISDIANSGTGLARYQAQELLCFFFNECDEYPVVVSGQQQTLSPIQEEESERIGDRQFIIYPNPANSWLTIVLPETDEILKMVITDISGKIVYSDLLSEPLHNFNTSNLTNGHYFITLTNQNGTIDFGTQQLIIQH